jgi:hypothetical protein
MASSEITAATLSFLTEAGHLLATTAPETSAYVMSRRNDLMFEHEMTLSDKQRQHVCTCCGHIMLFGKGSDLQFRPGKRPAKKPRSVSGSKGKTPPPLRLQTPSGPTKAITCGHCDRLTEVKLPAPTPISRRRVKVEKSTKASGPGVGAGLSSAAQEMPSQKTTSNASSKKRAKSRKAGLQALLSQSSASRPGLGLSLADFMDKK